MIEGKSTVISEKKITNQWEMHPIYKETRWPDSHLVRALVHKQPTVSFGNENYQSAAFYVGGRILPMSLPSEWSYDRWNMSDETWCPCDFSDFSDFESRELEDRRSEIKDSKRRDSLTQNLSGCGGSDNVSAPICSEIVESKISTTKTEPIVTVAVRVRLGKS